MSRASRFTWDLKQTAPAPRTGSGARTAALYGSIPALTEEFNDLVLRHADDHGELPDAKAVQAAEIAHRLFLAHSEEAEHYHRLSMAHREGRRAGR
ncbi:hypothetical protein [Saccharothrix deserti]|uniref:hypothetical protein n=1 Tax=Saccharothrix deserti TaxID=2593674 RepID=UPI00131DC88B|nr:hypothetical protein [Saccharothrix deserti]